MSHESQSSSRMDLISTEEEGRKRRHSRSRSRHKCHRPKKHHSEHCRKHHSRARSVSGGGGGGTSAKPPQKEGEEAENKNTQTQDQMEESSPPVYRVPHAEKYPETMEVEILPNFHLRERIAQFENRSRSSSATASAVTATTSPAARPDFDLKGKRRPTHYVANSARKVLLCSARGLKRLQQKLLLQQQEDMANNKNNSHSSSNLSSLYINQHFEDGLPCPVQNCPLNPSVRYISPKGDEPLFGGGSSSSASSSNSSLKEAVKKTSTSATRSPRSRRSGSSRRWCICVSLAILALGIFAAAGIYFGYSYLNKPDHSTERVYRGKFRIVTEEPWVPDPGSVFHLQKSEQFRKIIHQLMSGSALADQYKFTEVFLLDKDDMGILVNFNLHFKSDKKNRLFAKEISAIMESQMKTSGALPQVEIDSLDIQERKPPSPHVSGGSGGSVSAPGGGKMNYGAGDADDQGAAKPPVLDLISRRSCVAVEPGSYCARLPYNITTLPNILGHTTHQQVDTTVNTVREVVESGCHPLAYELMCQLIQPVCYKDRLVPPCQAFCQEFLVSCEDYLPSNIMSRLDCGLLPTEADGPGACISKPGCVNELRESGKPGRVCDGVVDCPDFSDELYCPYCPERHFHCGVGEDCIPKETICDGVVNCRNGADEKGCLSLSSQISAGSYIHEYHNSGYLLYQNKGRAGKVCAESLNKTDPAEAEDIVQTIAESTCQLMEYRTLDSAVVGVDEETENDDIQYVDIEALSETGDFLPVECSSKMVVRMECSGLDCGRRPAGVASWNQSTAVGHGDWPWQVALSREGVHVCDATIVDKLWLMATVSCFQGQSRAKWLAHVGSVRLTSRAPWEQTRRVVGMVKSPVEGHDIVLLKLEQPLVFSDFARPICLPATDEWTENNNETLCLSLGWDAKEDLIRPLELTRIALAQCQDTTEVSVNSLCVEAAEECQTEVVAGAGLVCQAGDSWQLVGVSAWRRGCGSDRPRLYDRVSLTTEWAARVISQISERPAVDLRIPRRRLGR